MLSEKKKNRCAADSGSSSYSVFRTAKQILPMQRQSRHFLPRITASVLQMGTVTVPQSPKPLPVHSYHLAAQGKPQSRPARQAVIVNLRQHRIIPALRLKHRSGSCGTASALPKCSIMSGCGTRIVLRGQKPLALCDRCPCFGSLFPPLAALTFAASSIICAFGLAAAAPRSPYRHLELCGVALTFAFAIYSAYPKIAKLCAPSTSSSPFTSALPITCSTRVPSSSFRGSSASSRAGFTAQISLPRSQANGR